MKPVMCFVLGLFFLNGLFAQTDFDTFEYYNFIDNNKNLTGRFKESIKAGGLPTAEYIILLNLESYSTGIIILHLQAGDGVFVKRFVIR